MNIHKIIFPVINSCKKSTELIEKKAFQPLTLIENIKLKLHLSMCVACKAYASQSEIIEKAIAQWFEKNKNKKLSEEVKLAIIQKATSIQ